MVLQERVPDYQKRTLNAVAKAASGELRIGEFAAMAGVSCKALRLYAAEGLLPPTRINPVNGYRFYNESQLDIIRRIKTLQAVGASLREIKTAIEAEGVLDDIEELLRRREAEMRRQQVMIEESLAEVRRQLLHIERHREQVRAEEESAAGTSVLYKECARPAPIGTVIILEEVMSQYDQNGNDTGSSRATFTRRSVIAGGIGGAVASGLTLSGAGAAPASQKPVSMGRNAKEENVLRYADNAPVKTAALDPANYYRIHYAMDAIYSRLAQSDIALNPVPDLAVSWSANEALDRWTFVLREGVTWHDGTPFTSKDVAFTYRRILDPNVSSVYGTYAIVDGDKIETPDDLTVVIVLNKPHADFPQLAMGFYSYVVPEHIGVQVHSMGIGTGPYKLISADPNGVTELEAFADYWKGPAPISKLEIYAVADSEARVNGLLANQFDSVGSLSPLQLKRVQDSGSHQANLVPDGGWTFLGVRCDVAPFDDIRVRKALKLVADRTVIHEAAIQSAGTIGYDQPVWENDQYGWKGDPARNIEEAKRLLTEAGFPDGLDITLDAADIHYWLPIALTYREQAKDAGINVTINMIPADGDYSVAVKDSAFRFEQWGARTADTVLSEAFRSDASANDSRWIRPEFDAMLDSARAEPDFESRKGLYQQAQQMINDDGGIILPFFGYRGFATAKDLVGIPAEATDINSFWGLSYL